MHLIDDEGPEEMDEGPRAVIVYLDSAQIPFGAHWQEVGTGDAQCIPFTPQ